jgi:hypothetical protein
MGSLVNSTIEMLSEKKIKCRFLRRRSSKLYIGNHPLLRRMFILSLFVMMDHMIFYGYFKTFYFLFFIFVFSKDAKKLEKPLF